MTQLTNPNSLREQAKRFEQAARKLREAAGVLEGLDSDSTGNGETETKTKKIGRVDQLSALLQQGPLSAKDVMAKIGIARGTMYQCFNRRKDLFENKNGLWALRS